MDEIDTTYNGWVNYSTWLTALWMDNFYELYMVLREVKAHTSFELLMRLSGTIIDFVKSKEDPDNTAYDPSMIDWMEIFKLMDGE